MPENNKKTVMKSIRFEPEVAEMIDEMCKDTYNSINGMVNYSVKEYYTQIFKAKH